MADNNNNDNQTKSLQKGDFCPPLPTDHRSPCPMLNALSNHGHLPRDGRSIRLPELKSALLTIPQLSHGITSLLASPLYLERKTSPSYSQLSLLGKAWYFISNFPWSLLQHSALRTSEMVDSQGERVINLSQLGEHGVIEHDISMVHHDAYQGDAITTQASLLELMVEFAGGKEYLTAEELYEFKKKRHEMQKEVNPELKYWKREHRLACMEMLILMNVIGDGEKIEVSRLKAFLGEERLPIKEGWRGNRLGEGRRYGFWELFGDMKKVENGMGDVLEMHRK